MTTQPEEMKVGSIDEAKDELSYRRQTFPRMVHSVANRYPVLVVSSRTVKESLAQCRRRAFARPSRSRYGSAG